MLRPTRETNFLNSTVLTFILHALQILARNFKKYVVHIPFQHLEVAENFGVFLYEPRRLFGAVYFGFEKVALALNGVAVAFGKFFRRDDIVIKAYKVA